ncbi:MAG: hypothetical protein KatS3mg110_1316 [Pirellulaceae bacterium]|nr:MAG: hypothetical protein KatS3mg110_1316 [Pirellulaceae bacterium]
MARIRRLPPSVVNQIAAGEVIERPASVVKELMENAIDAGARRIDVWVEQGGQELIRVSDDGCGMTPDELPLAVASHATSKIERAEDLFRIGTLGFRGEALASIAAVSRLKITSRTADADAGAMLQVDGGQVQPVVPCGAPAGTTVEVRHLFFNTPARRKFLRSTQTELGHIAEVFLRTALPFPQIHCTLRHGERCLHDLPPVERWRDRIVAAFGEELAENLLWVEFAEDQTRISGYVGDPNCNRPNNRWQYLFLNGRYIRDRSLQHALQEAYRGLLMQGRYPVAFLKLVMPPDVVDVNVHPTKLEVRFQDGGRLYSQLLATVRNRFLATDLTARVGRDAEPGQCRRDGAADTFVGDGPQGESPSGSGIGPQPPESLRKDATNRWDRDGEGVNLAARLAGSSPPDPGTHSGGASLQAVAEGLHGKAQVPSGIQILNRYLVAETDEGMLVIDQHALHERILFEQLRERVLQGTLEVQALLVPEPVTLGPADAALALEHASLLEQAGLFIEPFGGDAVLVTRYPALLVRCTPGEALRQVLDTLRAGGAVQRDVLLERVLQTMACRAAIKAGDPLSPQEIAFLLEHRRLCQDAHHCPHGRPTALVFSRSELDRRFKRI